MTFCEVDLIICVSFYFFEHMISLYYDSSWTHINIFTRRHCEQTNDILKTDICINLYFYYDATNQNNQREQKNILFVATIYLHSNIIQIWNLSFCNRIASKMPHKLNYAKELIIYFHKFIAPLHNDVMQVAISLNFEQNFHWIKGHNLTLKINCIQCRGKLAAYHG